MKRMLWTALLLFQAAVVYGQNNWVQKYPSVSPSARAGHGIAYITDDKVVLFGGVETGWSSLNSETWVYDLSDNTWTNTNPSTHPSVRAGHAMARIGDDKIALFGGLTDLENGTFDSETWIYDLSENTWTKMFPSQSPSARYGQGMSYLGSDKVLLYGGYDYSNNFPTETWVYDLSENRWTLMDPATNPGMQSAPVAMTSLGPGKALILGHNNAVDKSATWLYDLDADSWTLKLELTPPPSVYPQEHGISWLPGSDWVLLFEGAATPSTTYVYDLSENSWAQQYPTTNPSGRLSSALADIGPGKVLMFGGEIGGSGFTNETWLYSATLSALTYTISASAGAGGSITPSGSVVVNQGFDQTFTFAPSSCHQIANVFVDNVALSNPSSPYTFPSVTQNHTIDVQFEHVPPVAVTGNPASVTQCSGKPVTFSVTATGADPSYQWRKNGDAITGATDDHYTIASVAATDAGDYDVVVSGACSPSQTSSAATLAVRISPELDYSGTQNFTASAVSPASAGPTAGFRFEMKYTDPGGNFPQAGDPKLHLDYEGNGIFTDPDDLNLTMYPLDAGDMDVTDGKRYFIQLPTLPFGTNYKVTYTATNTLGCSSSFGPVSGPSVITSPNLAIYASDISFSDPHPAPGSSITVTAVIRNLTPTAASNISVRLVNQAFPLTSYPDILIPSLAGNSTTRVSWAITTPNVPSWNPMQVIVDPVEAVGETNELDNQAIRPFVNGNFAVAGDISVTASPSPAAPCSAPKTSVNVCGSAQYANTAVQLLDPSAAGATVTIHMVETDQTFSGTTNESGAYCIQVPAPITAGQYHVQVSVTDYTISGNTTTLFTVLTCNINGPDLISSISLGTNEITVGGSISGSVTVTNVGNQAASASTARLSAPDGTPATTATFSTPALGVGISHTSTFGPITFNTPGYYSISAMANADFEAFETDYANNASSNIVRVCPNLPDLAAQYSGNLQVYRCNPLVMSILNSTCVDVTVPVDVKLEVLQNNQLRSTYTQTLTGTVPRGGKIDVSFSNVFLSAGTYQVQFTVDTDGDITEAHENNNSCSYIFVVGDCKPDLEISFPCTPVITADPQHPGTITVNSILTNSGNAPVQATFVVDYETNGNHYPVTVSASLDGGSSMSLPVTIPTPPFGCAVLSATADLDDDVDELFEDNNTAEAKLSFDFWPGSTASCNAGLLFWERTQHVGIPVSLSVGLYNAGGYRASLVRTQFEISGPGITGWLDLGMATNTDVGQTCACAIRATLPASFVFLQTGTYYVRMTVDAVNGYTECNENNNVLVVPVEVAQSPDYRILSEHIAPSLLNPAIGQPITVSLTYENIGNTGSNDMEIGVTVDDVALDQERVPGLFQNTSNTVQFAHQWSSLIPGLHVIRGIVDADNEITETTESNNQATRAVVVGQTANLMFAQFEASDHSPALNSPITIDMVIQNTGPVDCNADLLLFYTDNTNAEVLFSQQPVGVLANGSLNVPIPWSVLNTHATLIGRLVHFSVPQSSHSGKEAQDVIGNVCSASITAAGNTSFCEGGSVVLTASDGISWLWSTNETTRSITVTASGDYSVTVTDASLCTSTSGVENITFFHLPTVTVTAVGPATFCEGGSVTLTASGADSYAWSNAATTASITVQASGTYSVTGTDANGCSALSNSITVVVIPLVSAGTVNGPSSLCINETATYSSDGTTGGTWNSANTAIATVHPTSGLVTAVGAGTTDITYTLSNGCGSPVTASKSVLVTSCLTFCTYTQGYYGNTNRIGFINTLLPITVGKQGRSLTFEANQGSCIASRLTAGSFATTLPAVLGDYSVGTSACPGTTIVPLLSTDKFSNVLLGQTITLALNVKYSPALTSFVLPASFCTQRTAQPGISGPFVIPSSVFSALSSLVQPQTVGGLLELANRALAGQGTGGASVADINNAVNAINVGFDECRTVITCPIPKESAQSAARDVLLSVNYPNPFIERTTISYAVPDECVVRLKVIDRLGRCVATLADGVTPTGTHSVVFDAGNLPPGTYLYRLEAGERVRTGMMTRVR